ncbi:flippase-like domain-containing protein [Pseudomonas sp. WS 5532]|uniref:lysylphosphatidylglycerol synthase transmembrane domain-containing protein n=1 Tax=unclassified Pseudomonas TaxID=196821 RepID=UPI0014748E3C|nr:MULTISPECIES: lysylphosphatidylglycerol synthase transmembrane domain-containing protein [unclassified Pseudomonas]NMX75141.1 flippase-like domain-containing protein [Pseudomonas sp. WS 5532]QXI57797.1 flippase-like domain-containing protein [Pseudomonas sp. OE 28.3]
MRYIKKSQVFLIIKLLLAGALVVALLNSGQLDFGSITVVFDHIDLFVPALICLFLGILISGFRWWLLLKATQNIIPLSTVLNLQLMGSFFSTWLPGAAGGDAVKGVQIFRLLESGRSTALISIVTDRVFAMLGLVSVAMLVSVFLPAAVSPDSEFLQYIGLLRVLVLLSFMGLILLVLGVFVALKFSLIDRLPIKIRHHLQPFGLTLLMYFRAWPTLLLCWVASLAATGIVIIGMVIIASMFPFAANAEVTAIAGVFGNLFSVIPITPGGLGVGESVFSKVCVELASRVAPFATIYFCFRVGMLVVNIPGMVATLLYSTKKHREKTQSLSAEKLA